MLGDVLHCTVAALNAGKLSVIAFSKSGLCQIFHEAHGGLHHTVVCQEIITRMLKKPHLSLFH